jgi:hypothetical protein
MYSSATIGCLKELDIEKIQMNYIQYLQHITRGIKISKNIIKINHKEVIMRQVTKDTLC